VTAICMELVLVLITDSERDSMPTTFHAPILSHSSRNWLDFICEIVEDIRSRISTDEADVWRVVSKPAGSSSTAEERTVPRR
jgi:hypothetical protein